MTWGANCCKGQFHTTPTVCESRGVSVRFTRDKRAPTRIKGFKNIGDGLLDYIEAGPKLRKWYGKGDKPPGKDHGPQDEDEADAIPDSILVTDADSPTGELVLLQLILARLKVTAFVRDAAAAREAYGDYVKPISGSIDNLEKTQQSLKLAQAVICVGKLGALPVGLAEGRPKHVVLLSSVGSTKGGFLSAVFDVEKRILADPSREENLRDCGVPLSIIRTDKILDVPGGTTEMSLTQGEGSPTGEISREDLAQLLVRALGKRPQNAVVLNIQSSVTEQQFKGWDKLFPDSL